MAGKGLQSGDPLPGVAGHRPAWFDPALPAREDCVLRDLLDSRARRYPDRICARFEDGSTLTYAECRAQTRAVAAALHTQGVRKGDRVFVWLPSGQAMVLSWFAINYLGAIYVPLNTAYKGAVLQHVVNAAAGAVMIAHPSLADRLQGLDLPHLRTVTTDFSQLEHGDGDGLGDLEPVDHFDIQSIIYTSGTTGLPLLTGFETAGDQAQMDVLLDVVNETSAEDFDTFDSLSLDLADSQRRLEQSAANAEAARDELERRRDQALAEVERLKEVEAQRLKDEAVRKALAAEEAERRRQAEAEAVLSRAREMVADPAELDAAVQRLAGLN
jgi:hypothetical protein